MSIQDWRRAGSFHGSRYHKGLAWRGDWSLETWQYNEPVFSAHGRYLSFSRQYTRYVLSGLTVTPREADAITGRRLEHFAPPRASVQYGYGPGLVLRLDDIELTADEAAAIADGTDPVAALAPRIKARPLTLEEMTGA